MRDFHFAVSPLPVHIYTMNHGCRAPNRFRPPRARARTRRS